MRRLFSTKEGTGFLVARSQAVLPASMVSVFDDQAELVAVSRSYPAPRVNIADREAYQVAAAGHGDIFVTGPLANRGLLRQARFAFFAG